jgi:hypothetical protein
MKVILEKSQKYLKKIPLDTSESMDSTGLLAQILPWSVDTK